MKIFAALLLSLFVLAGCGSSPEKQVIGSWKVDTAKTKIDDSKADEMEKKMAKSVIDTITLDVKEGKTFTLTMMSMPLEGTWGLAGNKLTLTFKLKEGEKVFGGKSSIDFEIDSSGSSMSSKIEDDKMPGTLVMTKSEAAK